MRLTAGLLTHNDEQYAARCLETLVVQTGLGTPNTDWRIVILDNASTDDAYLAEIEQKFPQVTLIREHENHGFSKGHNIIMRRFPADFHAVLNNDILFSPDFLALLVNALEEHPRFGSATGKLLHWDPGSHPGKTNVIDSCGIGVTFTRSFFDIGQGETDSGQYDAPAEHFDSARRSRPPCLAQCRRFGGSGAATVYRRTALEDVTIPATSYQLPVTSYQFFDERMFMYKEDIDLAYRLFNSGHPCLFVPGAVAWHARTTFKPRHARSAQERIWSAAHEFLIIQKHKRQWSFGVRCCTMVRQWCKWLFLLTCEPDVFAGARRLLKELKKPRA